jgi:hypothetical protein
LVTILGGQPNVELLAGTVTGPVRNVQDDALGSRGFVDQLDDRRELPVQSPW